MQEECVVAEFGEVEKARLGLEVLAKSGYGEEHISVVTRQENRTMRGVDELEKSKSDGEGAPSGAGAGGLLGTAVSVPLAASTLIGPFILLGPIVGAGIGAALGGMLAGASEKEDASAHYRKSLEQGGILLVLTGDKGELLDMEASIKTAGPMRVTRFASTVPHA